MLNLSRRRMALYAVVAGVLLSHALLTRSVMQGLADSAKDEPTIDRMEAELVADMKLTAPPVVSALPVPAALPSLPDQALDAPPAASAASQPKLKKTAPDPVSAASTTSAPEAPPSASSSPTQVAETVKLPNPASAPETPPSAPVFEWPKATRVTYKMEGYLRGPIYGTAMVEWIRQDLKYQVHVDAYAGPSFAPLASQRWTSEGIITPKGLLPSRFESVNKLLIKSSTPKVVVFEDKTLLMPDGERIDKLPDVQDPASHYIQMAYQFMLDASALQVGKTIEMPMANTKKQQAMVYDIEAQEMIDTPLGQVDTFRLKPRIPAKNSKGEDIFAEIWIAPSLQYLPIRMLIRIGNETFFDMKMDKAPQQTAADAPMKFPELR